MIRETIFLLVTLVLTFSAHALRPKSESLRFRREGKHSVGLEADCAQAALTLLTDVDHVGAMMGLSGIVKYRNVVNPGPLPNSGLTGEKNWAGQVGRAVDLDPANLDQAAATGCNRNARFIRNLIGKFEVANIELDSPASAPGMSDLINSPARANFAWVREQLAAHDHAVATILQDYAGSNHYFNIEFIKGQGYRFYQGSQFAALDMNTWLGANAPIVSVTEMTAARTAYGGGKVLTGADENAFFTDMDLVQTHFQTGTGPLTGPALAAYVKLFGHQPGSLTSTGAGSVKAIIEDSAGCDVNKKAIEAYMSGKWMKEAAKGA